jgi:hypothetical protein
MSYSETIIARIKNPEKWPAHLRGEFLDELNEIADNAFSKGTIEGYLASVLIYIQISEELVSVLLECCEFFIQLGIFPNEIQFKHGEKRMFGQILNETPYRFLCNGVKREYVKTMPVLASSLFFNSPLHKIRALPHLSC